MNDQAVRARWARTTKRHREGQGAGVSTLRAVGDASIRAGESGKRRG